MNYQLIMEKCFEEATKYQRNVAPNPMVGSALVYENNIISLKAHQKYGESHAEINCMKSVDDKILKNSTLFVTLEPCSHFGKTPPCAEAIIKAGIKKVVISNLDPNPLVAGKGIELLKENGIEVVSGVLEQLGRNINKRFFTFHEKKRPYVIFKFAKTSDNFIARKDYSSKWITCSESRELVHKYRSEEQSILVGTNTAIYDNPELTARIPNAINPIRLVIDRNLKIPKNYKLFDKSNLTIVFNENIDSKEENLHFIKIDFSESVVKQILEFLYKSNILSVFVEGGSQTINNFVKDNLWDEARVFTAETKFIEGILAPKIVGKKIHEEFIKQDKLEIIIND